MIERRRYNYFFEREEKKIIFFNYLKELKKVKLNLDKLKNTS
jgi:hypothetical protein